MLIDITMPITPTMIKDAQQNDNPALVGHLGTHFDVMDNTFPLAYTVRDGIVFDVRHVTGRDIDISDVDLDAVCRDMFVAFYTGYTDREIYGSAAYFSQHPQLSDALIDALLDKHISIIGVDCAGVRRGKQHTPKDQYCADRGVFVVENLVNLSAVAAHGGTFVALTYPMNGEGITGLPCRVIADV